MSQAPLLSPLWYRIAYLKPRLKSGVRVARHQVRGRTWYILSDPVTGRHHRFDAQAYALIAACDGSVSIDEVWGQCVDADGDGAATQAQAIDVFSQAFRANLLAGDVAADARAAMRTLRQRTGREKRQALNPLSFKLPLLNPHALLTRVAPALQGLFGPWSVRLGLAVMLLGAVLMGVYAGDLARDASQHPGQGRMLLMLWLVYPLIKALHEFAHALAVTVYGGEVHEMGVSMLLLTPVPYVDASASSAFESKHKRALVAGAGIAVEWLVATAALLVWLAVEPGLVRELALTVTVVGGVSTLVINGNPLLRFDGYHVLCDVMELPNLAPRSTRWWLVGLQRLMLGPDASSNHLQEAVAGGERAWLAAYAPVSWLMRGALMVSLALALAAWHAWVGLLVLILAVWWMLGKPLLAALRWMADAPQMPVARARVYGVTAAATAAFAAVTFLAPLPHRTLAPGVVWLPQEALVRLPSDGFVEAVLVAQGQRVAAGTPLLRLRNEPLHLALAKVEADLVQARVDRQTWIEAEPARAAQAEDRVQALEAEQRLHAQRVQGLEVRAGTAGAVSFDAQRLVRGRHLAQGEWAATVLASQAHVVRVLVAHDAFADVRLPSTSAHVVLAHAGASGATHVAQWQRSVPGASRQLITAALGTKSGGAVTVDPTDVHGTTALEPRFDVELQLPPGVQAHVGERAWVRFDHGSTTLARWSVQWMRKHFLRHFASGVQA
jgi:putative peptide zinc metalloprotease protein